MSLRLAPGAEAVGQTLRALNLRGRSGATVLGIARGAEQILLPDGAQVLRAGDVLALAGTTEAIAGARAELERREAAPAGPDGEALEPLR